MARSDVQLVIRAKDEAAKAFEAVASALADVLTVGNKVAAGAERTSVSLSDLAATTVALDKVYSQIVGSADRAAAAFERQAKGIAESKAQLASLKEQAAAAQAVLARLKSPDAIMEAGRNQGPRFKQIEEITRQYNLLVEAQNRVEASIRTQEASLNSGRGALQQLGSTVIAVEDAQARLAAESVLVTDAIQEQTQAVSRLTDVQRRINAITGAGRGDATVSAARSAEILAEAAARDEVIQKLKEEQERVVALAQAQEAQARVSQFLIGGSGKSAKDSAAVFSEADAKLAEENAAILARVKKETNELTIAEDRLRAQINPLAIVQEKLNTALAEADRLYKAGRISATELAAAQKLLTGNAERARQAINGNSGLDSRGRPSLFGLKPYELTNLGYQINDLVTQVASGTSLTQALAQQGGQILQLFPRVGAAIVAALSSGPLLTFAAALGAIALGVRRVFDEADKLRTFSAQLALSADGANYQAESLVKSAKALDLYGLSAEEATKAVSIFVREGLDDKYIVAFGQSALTLSKVLGIDVADAAKQVADAFTGGIEAVKKLDDATGFLSATEREYIRTLFASGDAAKARETAFEFFYAKQEESAEQMRGPWSDAVRSLEGAWQSFLDLLGESSVIGSVVGALEALANGVSDVLNTLSGSQSLDALQSRAETVGEALGLAIQRVDNLKKQQAAGALFSDDLFPVLLKTEIDRGEKRIRELLDEFKELGGKIAGLTGGAPSGDPLRAGISGAGKQDADLARLSQERADAAAKLTQEYTDQAIAARLLRVEEEARLDLQNKFPLASNERINAEVAATVERERLKIQKEVTELKERQASAEERAIKAASKSIIGIESSGNPNAKNGLSTATGLGQFIESTWLRLFKENFPDRAKDLTNAAILALRTDSEISKQMIEIYARENAKTLQRAGQAVTEANLALAHFLGPDGAVKVLQADPNTLVSDILSADAINANKRRLAGKTAGQVIAEQQRLVDGNAGPQAALAARLAALAKERADKQREFNEGIDQENQKRQQTTASLEAQKGLSGLALLEEQKRQAVADAVLAKQQEVDRTNADLRSKGLAEISLTQEQIKVIEELTAKQFELANAKQYAAAQRDAVQQPVDDLTAQRDALLAQIEFYQQTGQTGLAEGLEPQLAAINAQLDQAIAKAIAFYEALANNPDALAALGLTAGQVQAIADKLSTSGTGARELGREFIATGRAINEQFARGAANALDQFSQKVADGVPVLQALKEAFLQFAADFLRYIAQMIFQQIIFNLVSGSIGGSGSGGLGAGISTVLGKIKHDGGTIGEAGGRSRMVSMAAFANARRMHTGGVVGFAPNEVPIIAERGETIRTKAQEEEIQRQLAAGAGGGQGAVNLKVVNAFDEAEVVSQGLNTDAGERAVLNMARRNAGAFRQALGLG